MSFRKKARSLTINVNLCRHPDALDSEKRLDAIYYGLAWQKDILNEPWILHRRNKRGWESHYDGWRWISNEADSAWYELLSATVESLPSGVTAIVASKEGIGVIWDERGDDDLFKNLHQSLIGLRKKGEEICT
jgi:nitroreductase